MGLEGIRKVIFFFFLGGGGGGMKILSIFGGGRSHKIELVFWGYFYAIFVQKTELYGVSLGVAKISIFFIY